MEGSCPWSYPCSGPVASPRCACFLIGKYLLSIRMQNSPLFSLPRTPPSLQEFRWASWKMGGGHEKGSHPGPSWTDTLQLPQPRLFLPLYPLNRALSRQPPPHAHSQPPPAPPRFSPLHSQGRCHPRHLGPRTDMTNPSRHFSPQSLSGTRVPVAPELALPVHGWEDGDGGSGCPCGAVTWPPQPVRSRSPCWSWAVTHKLWMSGLPELI